ncbi:MAG TPA: GNAT family N-acetyltransferase [Methanomassiliicoccales archaeon]|jgi:GNAT superfamily N-acetyltransferase
MKVIRGDASHLEQIMEIWKGFMEYHQRIDSYYGTVEGGHLKFGEYIRERMGRSDSLVLAAMDGKDLVGYCLCYVQERPPIFTERTVGILSDLAVKEEHRGGGAGGALLEESLGWLRNNGVKRVELRTSARNHQAIEFYEKHGFWIYDHMMTREI